MGTDSRERAGEKWRRGVVLVALVAAPLALAWFLSVCYEAGAEWQRRRLASQGAELARHARGAWGDEERLQALWGKMAHATDVRGVTPEEAGERSVAGGLLLILLVAGLACLAFRRGGPRRRRPRGSRRGVPGMCGR
jgi:hypothetical protein